MTDRLSPQRRSALMSRVTSKDTTPELSVRQRLHRLGYRYRLHRKDLPGKPDLTFGRSRKAIFIHGCFWHGHEGCRFGRLPKSNLDYWQPKLERNMQRDRANAERLREAGWDILVLWQCELKDIDGAIAKLVAFLEDGGVQYRGI
ncbi:MAG: very short patch repair endonuclease [Thermosynechococcaceae cyanobacterium]